MAKRPGVRTDLTRRQELPLAAAAAVHAAQQAADPAAAARRIEGVAVLRERLSRLLETGEQDLELNEDIEQPSVS